MKKFISYIISSVIWIALIISSPADAQIRITCIGASDVSTPTPYGTPNYPDYLAQMLGYGYKITNCGASGTTMIKTGNAPYWNTQQFIDSNNSSPNIVIIMLGTNDSKSYNWVNAQTEYVPDYNSLIANYQGLASHPTIYLNTLLTVYPPGNYDITSDAIVSGTICPWIQQIGVAHNLPVFDVNASTKNMSQNFPDNIHPDIAGAKVVAQTVFNGLMLAGQPPPIVSAALNKTVVASSVADGTVAANAVDGDWTTRWSSAYTDNEWIYVDLGSAQNVNGVDLNWETAYASAFKIQVSNNASTWNDVYSTTTGTGGIQTISFTPTSARYVRMLGVHRATTYGYSLWDFTVTTTTPLLPAPWVGQDVGSIGVNGSSSATSGTFTVSGSGAAIGGTADAFRYVYAPALNTTANITARVATEGNTNASSQAGVMIRNSLDPADMSAAVVVTPGSGLSFVWRSTYGGTASHTTVTGVTAPRWVRVARTGTTFTGSYSSDGVTWTTIGTPQTMAMAASSLATSTTVGLVVSSNANTQLNTSTFDHVTINTQQLICQSSGDALDNAGSTTSGTHVTQWGSSAGNINQDWVMTNLNNGYYKLTCLRSGMVLDNGGSMTAGAQLTQSTDNAGTNTNQQWAITNIGGGHYTLTNHTSGMNLDNGGSNTNGAIMTQWNADATNANQQWSFQAP